MWYEFIDATSGGRFVLRVDESSAERQFFRERADPLLTIAWNRGAAQTLLVDGVPVAVPAGAFVALVVNQTFRFARPSALVLWQFNRAFYCIVEHDREVSCAGLLFYGSYGAHGAAVLEPGPDEGRRYAALLEVFVDECATRDAIQGEMLRMLLTRLLIKLTRLARVRYAGDALAGPQLDTVRQFHLLVEHHYARLHRVGDYAQLLHKSPKTVANLFARRGGASAQRVIHARVALEAKRLLTYTDRSAKQIAHDLGFLDPAAFSRFFRTEVGTSATAYRQTRGGEEPAGSGRARVTPRATSPRVRDTRPSNRSGGRAIL